MDETKTVGYLRRFFELDNVRGLNTQSESDLPDDERSQMSNENHKSKSIDFKDSLLHSERQKLCTKDVKCLAKSAPEADTKLYTLKSTIQLQNSKDSHITRNLRRVDTVESMTSECKITDILKTNRSEQNFPSKKKPIVAKKPISSRISKFPSNGISVSAFSETDLKSLGNISNERRTVQLNSMGESSISEMSDISNCSTVLDRVAFYSSIHNPVNTGYHEVNKSSPSVQNKNKLTSSNSIKSLNSVNINSERKISVPNSSSYKYIENWNNENSYSSSNNRENKRANESDSSSTGYCSQTSIPQSILRKNSSITSRSQKSLSFKKDLVSFAPDSDATSEESFLSFNNDIFERENTLSTKSTFLIENGTICSTSTLRNETPIPLEQIPKSAQLEIGCSASNIYRRSRIFMPDASYTISQ